MIFLTVLGIVLESVRSEEILPTAFNENKTQPRGPLYSEITGWVQNLHEACSSPDYWVRHNDNADIIAGTNNNAGYYKSLGENACDNQLAAEECVDLCVSSNCHGVNFNHNNCNCYLWKGCDTSTLTANGNVHTFFRTTPAPTKNPTSSPSTSAPTDAPSLSTSATTDAPSLPPSPTALPTAQPTDAPTTMEDCTVSDFTKIMMYVSSTLCFTVAAAAVWLSYLLEKAKLATGYREVVSKHRIGSLKYRNATPEEKRGLV